MSGNNNDDESVSVRGVAIATAVGVVLLIFIVLLFVVVLFHWTRKKSRKACSIDDKQQYTHFTAGLSQCDHHAQVVLSRRLNVEPISRLETINGAYISTKVKSLDSLLQQHGHSRSTSDAAGCNVANTSNPSHDFGSNSPQADKKSEQLEYDYPIYSLSAASNASNRVCGKVIKPASDHCDHPTKDMPSQKLKVEPVSRLETINGAYISTHKVKSLDSLLRQHSYNESVCSCNVTITLNPSYDVAINTLQTKKEPEQLECDFTSDGLLAASVASGGACGKANDPVNDDDVNITANPSYSLPQDGQDVTLQDNPCYV